MNAGSRRFRRGPRRAVLALAVLPFALGGAPAAAQARPMQSYDVGRGLAGDRVSDLALDRSGRLWIATVTGLSRFDGSEFRNFGLRDGLGHVVVPRLLVGRDARLWAGSNRGLSVLDPGEVAGTAPFRLLPATIERSGGRIACLAEDAAGTLWAGGELGLLRVAGAPGEERLEPVAGPTDGRRLLALAADPAGGLWAAFDDDQLHHRTPEGSWRSLGAPPDAAHDPNGVGDLVVDGRGRLWLATRTALCAYPLAREPNGAPLDFEPARVRVGGLEELASDRAACADLAHGLPETYSTRALRLLTDGRVLAAATTGVVELGERGARVVYRPEPGEPFAPTVALDAEDGTLWIGTRANGLLRLPASGISAYGEREGLGGNLSTLLASDAEVFVVLDFFEAKRRLLRSTGGSFEDVTPPGAPSIEPHFAWGATNALGADGAWWVVDRGGLLRHARRGPGFAAAERVRPPSIADALARTELFRIFVERSGALWLAGDNPPALFRYDPAQGAARAYPEVEALGRGAPTAFAESPAGEIWLGFYRGGLARLPAEPGARLEPVGEDADPPQGFVYALRFDRRGRLWAGTAGSGLVRLDEPAAEQPKARVVTAGSEIDSLQVYDVAEDDLGHVFAATARGVAILDSESGNLLGTLTSGDGLPGSSAAGLVHTVDGTLWIATDRGVARYRPPERRRTPPTIRISELVIAGRPHPLPIDGAQRVGGLRLEPAERLLEVEVTSPHLGAGAPPRFEWRTGAGDWSAPTGDRRLRLAEPAPGRLRIEARAIGSDGVRSRENALVELVVLPPLWRRPTFVALAAAALAAALAAAYRLRVARLLALERVRTRIAADLHDDLGSSLSRISILAEVARRQSGSDGAESTTLEEIGRTARELGEMASDIVWAIDPQRDDLGSLVARLRRFGSDLFEPAGVRFAIEAPTDAASLRLGTAERRDLYLLLKEGLNNAAKYAGARSVSVRIARAGAGLRIELADDGAGIDAEAASRAEARGGGHGLRSMRERAARLGGRLELDSAPGRGTRIALDLSA